MWQRIMQDIEEKEGLQSDEAFYEYRPPGSAASNHDEEYRLLS